MKKKNVKKERGLIERIVRFLFNKETMKNKICAMFMIFLGWLSAKVIGGDCTALIFISLIAIPMFFSNENWIDE